MCVTTSVGLGFVLTGLHGARLDLRTSLHLKSLFIGPRSQVYVGFRHIVSTNNELGQEKNKLLQRGANWDGQGQSRQGENEEIGGQRGEKNGNKIERIREPKYMGKCTSLEPSPKIIIPTFKNSCMHACMHQLNNPTLGFEVQFLGLL